MSSQSVPRVVAAANVVHAHTDGHVLPARPTRPVYHHTSPLPGLAHGLPRTDDDPVASLHHG